VYGAVTTFGSSTGLQAGDFPFVLLAGDFNGDHALDLVVGSQTAGTLMMLLGNGDGTFQTGKITLLGNSTQVDSLVAADFNADSKLDLAAHVVGALVVLLGNGDGTFQPTWQLGLSTPKSGFLVAGDFNGDHNIDLVLRQNFVPSPPCRLFCIGSERILLYVGQGDGSFQAGIPIASLFGSLARKFTAADVQC
jgi:FG-GAP-like repeat